MKLHLMTLTAALAALTACGGADNSGLAGNGQYSVQSGKFAVSNVQTAEHDWCGILPDYQATGRQITVTNTNGKVTFNLDNVASPVADWLPSATLSNDVLTWPVRANYSPDRLPDNCELGITKTVSGEVSGNDTLELRLDVELVDLSDTPGTCTPEDAHATHMPCTSSITFTAKRVP